MPNAYQRSSDNPFLSLCCNSPGLKQQQHAYKVNTLLQDRKGSPYKVSKLIDSEILSNEPIHIFYLHFFYINAYLQLASIHLFLDHTFLHFSELEDHHGLQPHTKYHQQLPLLVSKEENLIKIALSFDPV